MSIGLCGAHRTGKTTLARAFSELQGLPFVQTRVSEVFKRLGRDPAVDYPLRERLAIQSVILESLTAQYAEAQKTFGNAWITDRTPLDLAGYMLSEVLRENCADPALNQDVLDYIGHCMDACNRFFSVIVLVQPGIQIVEEEGKAPGHAAYIEHCNAVMMGLLLDSRLHNRHYYIKRAKTSLKDRLDGLASCVKASLEAHQRTMEAATVAIH